MTRPSGRNPNELRNVSIEPHVSIHADGSCLITFGDTKVICTASIDERVPPFLRNKGTGWVTAEYGMLPGSTGSRMRREATQGKQGGRTVEIQRLIGRSLRAAVDMKALGERQIIIDCDVLQADGGTRTASITGGYVALHLAIKTLMHKGLIQRNPLKSQIAAISCGVYKGTPVTDLDYAEDSKAEVDANFIMDNHGKLIEVQGTGEEAAFSREELNAMLDLAETSIQELMELQNVAINTPKK